VVFACNTATALSLTTLKAEFDHLPMTGVIQPGAKAAVAAAGNKPHPRIAVIATEATVNSKAYEHAIFRRRQYAKLKVRATPLLAPIIEDGRDEADELVRLALSQYLQPIAAQKPDVLVLGCTHYPVYKNLIAQMMGPNCQVIDSAEQCAQDVTQRLAELKRALSRETPGYLKCFVTDDPAKFRSLAGRFLGSEIDEPTRVTIEELTKQPVVKLRKAG
jgi:glutamate racemase